MKNKKTFKELETAKAGDKLCLGEVLDGLRLNTDGLVPVIAQCANSKQVLMLAWMNREALMQTLETGQMTYYSRSRQALWRKGETSGCTQKLVSISVDCDGDTILAIVQQTGVACHTGRQSCFYVDLNIDSAKATIKESGNS